MRSLCAERLSTSVDYVQAITLWVARCDSEQPRRLELSCPHETDRWALLGEIYLCHSNEV